LTKFTNACILKALHISRLLGYHMDQRSSLSYFGEN
jgi:hypothetical protein